MENEKFLNDTINDALDTKNVECADVIYVLNSNAHFEALVYNSACAPAGATSFGSRGKDTQPGSTRDTLGSACMARAHALARVRCKRSTSFGEYVHRAAKHSAHIAPRAALPRDMVPRS